MKNKNERTSWGRKKSSTTKKKEVKSKSIRLTHKKESVYSESHQPDQKEK